MAYQALQQQKEEERDKQLMEFEEEARFKISQMQEAEVEGPTKRKFPSFRARSPIQVPIPTPPPFQEHISISPIIPKW